MASIVPCINKTFPQTETALQALSRRLCLFGESPLTFEQLVGEEEGEEVGADGGSEGSSNHPPSPR